MSRQRHAGRDRSRRVEVMNISNWMERPGDVALQTEKFLSYHGKEECSFVAN
jgi:hypothetical protein